MPLASRDPRSSSIDFLLHAGLVLAGMLALYALVSARPVAYITLISEDYWAEYASAVAWLLASLFLCVELAVDRASRRVGSVLIAAIAFAAALAEVSFGERILGPGAFLFPVDAPLPGALSSHELVADRWTLPLVAPAVVVFGLVLPWLAPRRPAVAATCRRFGVPVPGARVVPFFALALLLLAVPDSWLRLLRSEELGELALAVAVCLTTGWHLIEKRRAVPASPLLAVAISFGLVLATFALAAPWVAVFDRPEELHRNLVRFASVELPQMGRFRESQQVFDHLEADPSLRRSEFHFDRARTERAAGREGEARATLERGLREYLAREPGAENAIPARTVARLLRALDREAEAAAAFARALAVDAQRLARSPASPDRSAVHASLARTRAAMGDLEGAAAEVAQALAASPDPQQQERLRRWLTREQSRARRSPNRAYPTPR